MLYGRFTITMSYHKKVNAVALVHYPKILESATGKWYNSYNECDG